MGKHIADKRKRVKSSCAQCRKSKIKCDKSQPACSNCIRKRIPAIHCVYDDSPFNPSKENELQNQVLQLIEENTRLSSALLEWKEVNSDKDKCHYDFTDFTSFTDQPNRLSLLGPTSWQTLMKNDPDVYSVFFKNSPSIKKDVNCARSRKAPPRPLKLAITYSEFPLEEQSAFLRKLEESLPSYSVLAGHIEYLKTNRTILAKFYDDDTVSRYFESMFIPCDEKFVLEVTGTEYGKLALILVLVQFSEMLQNSAKRFESYGLIETCLNYANLSTCASVPAFQTMVFLCMHSSWSPDVGERVNSSILVMLTLNMAIMLGLHLDIDTLFPEASFSWRQSLRACWRWFVFMDARNSFNMGVYPIISEDFLRVMTKKDMSEIFERTKLMRSLMRNLLSGGVNIDAEIERTRVLARSQDPLSLSQLLDELQQAQTTETVRRLFIKLNFFHIIQVLLHLAYVKTLGGSIKYRVLCAKYSVVMIKVAELLVERYQTQTDLVRVLPQNYFLSVIRQISLRSSIFMLSCALMSIRENHFSETGAGITSLPLSELEDLDHDVGFAEDPQHAQMLWNLVEIHSFMKNFYTGVGGVVSIDHNFYDVYVAGKQYCEYIHSKMVEKAIVPIESTEFPDLTDPIWDTHDFFDFYNL